MTRLQAELHRLYLPRETALAPSAADLPSLIGADGRVRGMALTLGRPADWEALSRVWQAVQSELALPAPAIAVSGLDGYQLWFALEEAVPLPQAHAFLASLRDRFLAHIAPARVGWLPQADAGGAASGAGPTSSLLPPQQVCADQWSAFVAPDLAPMFAETPWLDIPPSPDGQADLLSRLQPIRPAAWRAVMAEPPSASASASARAVGPERDPRRFLLAVMNDDSVALALRIEAAKALLTCAPPATDASA